MAPEASIGGAGVDPLGDIVNAPAAFVSYRRRDTGPVAELLANRLNGDIGSARVFYDNDDLYAGDFIVEHLDDALADADGVLALIGYDWAVEDGRNRIAEPEDHVRREVAAALGRKTVIPVLVDGAPIPTDLPDDLARLPDCRWIDMSSVDHEPAYQEALVALWAKRCRKAGRMLVIASPSQRGHVKVEEFLAYIRDAGIESASSVSQFAAGIAAIPIRKARRRWPDIVVIADEDEPSAAFLARLRGMEYWGPAKIALVAGASAAGGAGGPALVKSIPELAEAELFTSPGRLAAVLAPAPAIPVAAVAAGVAVLAALVAGVVFFWPDDGTDVVTPTTLTSPKGSIITEPTTPSGSADPTDPTAPAEPTGVGDWTYPGYTQDFEPGGGDPGGGGGDEPPPTGSDSIEGDVPPEEGTTTSDPSGGVAIGKIPRVVLVGSLPSPVVELGSGTLHTEAAGCDAPCDITASDSSGIESSGPLDGQLLGYQGGANWTGQTRIQVRCGKVAVIPAGVTVTAQADSLAIRIRGEVDDNTFGGKCTEGTIVLQTTATPVG